MKHTDAHEFTGLKGHVFAWFLTSPFRRVLEWKMGRPEERLLELLQLDGDERVLDSGCGSGFHSLLLADRLPRGRVMAVDLSQEMLGRLRRNAAARGLEERVEVQCASSLDLPMADGSMDRAISAAVWHHLDDPQRACDELARVLRPGGRTVVVDLGIGGPENADVRGLKGHDTPFGIADMRRIFEQSGLVDVQVETIGRWVIGAGNKALDS